jgi:phage baseplate assembly protein W
VSQLRDYRIQQGDSLRSIAYRQYHDASRWREIADLNGLRYPHVIDSLSPSDRLPGTVILGDTIRLRTPAYALSDPPANVLFGQDLNLDRGSLQAVDGDLALTAGIDNFRQSLQHRVKTLTGELLYYPAYGCNVQLALGLKLEPLITLMGAAWVQESLRQETRLSSVDRVIAQASGDSLEVSAHVTAIGQNTPVDLNLVVP